LPPELNTLQKIREKLKEIEQASGRKLKSVVAKIIEQHALGDENKKERIELSYNPQITVDHDSGIIS